MQLWSLFHPATGRAYQAAGTAEVHLFAKIINAIVQSHAHVYFVGFKDDRGVHFYREFFILGTVSPAFSYR